MENCRLYRWICPDPHTIAAKQFGAWAAGAVSDAGSILCHPDDLAALQETILAPRVTLPESGRVQRGTLWLETPLADPDGPDRPAVAPRSVSSGTGGEPTRQTNYSTKGEHA